MDTLSYVVRRLLYMVPILVVLTMGTFGLTRLAGDPAGMYIVPGMSAEQRAQVRERYGLNDPLPLQYWAYLSGLLRGDLGYSRAAGMPVLQAVRKYFPATIELTGFSMAIATLAGIWLGTRSAVRKNSTVDHVTRVLALGGVSMPIFWLALILLAIFYAQLNVLPIGRFDADIWPASARHTNFYIIDALINRSPRQLIDALRHLVLPGFCLGYLQLALIMRMMRSSMLEVLREDYVRSARSKGLTEATVVNKHARRNALLPTVTIIGFTFGTMLTGSILTEKVFNWPGMGMWAVRAILSLDTTSIMGYVLVTGFIYIMVNLLTDILYTYMDPRVRVA